MKKLFLGLLKKLKFLPPAFYVKVYYEYYTGKKLDLKDPKEFNAKIQWLKVYYKNPLMTKLVDKYAVRDYVRDKVGEQYLNDLLAVYDKASEVDFEKLPEQFVIKGVHGCHFNLIVPDKSQIKPFKARYLLRKWMAKNQFYRGGLEWAYKDVPHRLIAERYLSEMGKSVINDYKFFCFYGVPKFVQIDVDRGVQNLRCFYTLAWEKQAFNVGNTNFYEGELDPPENFEEMIEVSRKLAADFPFVRVDLYNIDGRILFGEMTFYPSDGRNEFRPDEYNRILGDLLELPEPWVEPG